jgi:hypothetical protein
LLLPQAAFPLLPACPRIHDSAAAAAAWKPLGERGREASKLGWLASWIGTGMLISCCRCWRRLRAGLGCWALLLLLSLQPLPQAPDAQRGPRCSSAGKSRQQQAINVLEVDDKHELKLSLGKQLGIEGKGKTGLDWSDRIICMARWVDKVSGSS